MFLGLFVLLTVPLYILMSTTLFQERLFPPYLAANAEVAAWLIRLFGLNVHVEGATLVSTRFSAEIMYGCDAIEPSGLYAAAVLAFPVAWRMRAMGAAVGVAALLLLNLARIVSLFFIGTHRREWFEVAHLQVWQVAFIIAGIALWVAWVRWSLNRTG